VNVKEIDEQHQKFIEILNNLYEHISTKKPRSELEDLYKKAVAFAALHFATEEKYFDKFHYEFAEEHKLEHAKLKKQVADFYKEFQENTRDITFDLIDFLENWLVEHLVLQDKKYTTCFNEHGLL
jgi:hemerythrin-like metal-binding protein